MKTSEKTVYLREYCTTTNCGGRMHRTHTEESIATGDDNGSEVYQFRLVDTCDTCARERYPVTARHPNSGLAPIFEQFEKNETTRAEFDAAIAAQLAKVGAHWETKVG